MKRREECKFHHYLVRGALSGEEGASLSLVEVLL